MTKRASPASSWLTMTEPASACLCQTRFARSAIVSCGRAWKIETCRSRCVLSKGGRSGSVRLESRASPSARQGRLTLSRLGPITGRDACDGQRRAPGSARRPHRSGAPAASRRAGRPRGGGAQRRSGEEGAPRRADARARRSEEHTSELQSPCNLVCRLLLEKKKKKTIDA